MVLITKLEKAKHIVANTANNIHGLKSHDSKAMHFFYIDPPLIFNLYIFLLDFLIVKIWKHKRLYSSVKTTNNNEIQICRKLKRYL